MADKYFPDYPEKVNPVNEDYGLLADSEDVKVDGKRKFKKYKLSNSPSINSNVEFYNTIIDAADDDNTRNDQPSIIKLDDGRLFIAYSHYGDVPADEGLSKIWGSFSRDDGQTWETPFLFIDAINTFGTYIPSFYKKNNGNILCVFFVRVQTTPTRLSAIYQIEFNQNLNTVVPATEILSPTGYFPIGSDRLFYDETNERLLLPYPKLISGNGASTISLYEGRLLVSDDEGGTWADAGISIGLDQTITGGFGGATEPGIYLNPITGNPVYYYGTLLGSWYASQLTPAGATYTAGTPYNTNLYGQNGFGTIKYWPERGIYLGAKVRLLNNLPLVEANKQIIDLSASVDGLNWFDVIQVENVPANDGFFALEPIIYIDNNKDRVLIAYSASYIEDDFYYLKSAVLPSVAISLNFTKTVLNQNFSYQEAFIKILGNIEVKNNANGDAIKVIRETNTNDFAIVGFYDESNTRIGYIGLAEDGADQHLNEVVATKSKLSLVGQAYIFGSTGQGYRLGIKQGKIFASDTVLPIADFNNDANYVYALSMKGGAEFVSTTQPLVPPIMTEAQKNAIPASIAKRGIIFNGTSGKFEGYNGSGWVELG